tara:strand:- start:12 stop:230 length:219 start_codon:yes stop_codon:yes gene_type:complete
VVGVALLVKVILMELLGLMVQVGMGVEVNPKLIMQLMRALIYQTYLMVVLILVAAAVEVLEIIGVAMAVQVL